MPGKLPKMETHLRHCQKIPNETRIRAIAELAADKENAPNISTINHSPHILPDSGSSNLVTPTRALKRSRSSTSSFGYDSTPQWSSGRQEEFDDDMLKLFVSCGFAWNSANNPQMGLFVEKWIPGAKVPDRKSLSGRILDREVAKVEARTRERVQGKVATGQCDGWKNVAKTSIVTSMITVEHVVSLTTNNDPT